MEPTGFDGFGAPIYEHQAPRRLAFTVDGVAVPQGSKTAFVVGGRAVLTDANRSKLKPWRATVTAAAIEAARGFQFPGAVRVWCEFNFVRPKSSKRDYPSVKPDLDKLVRGLLDGLTDSGVIRDDALVVSMTASKRYADRPHVRVSITDMGGQL